MLLIYFIFLKLSFNFNFFLLNKKNYFLKIFNKNIFYFLQSLILVFFPVYDNFLNLNFKFLNFKFSINFIINNFFLSFINSFFFSDVLNILNILKYHLIFFFNKKNIKFKFFLLRSLILPFKKIPVLFKK